MEKAPLTVSMARGGPALRPLAVTKTSFVGENMILVFRGDREMSVRFPVTVVAGAAPIANRKKRVEKEEKKKTEKGGMGGVGRMGGMGIMLGRGGGPPPPLGGR